MKVLRLKTNNLSHSTASLAVASKSCFVYLFKGVFTLTETEFRDRQRMGCMGLCGSVGSMKVLVFGVRFGLRCSAPVRSFYFLWIFYYKYNMHMNPDM